MCGKSLDPSKNEKFKIQIFLSPSKMKIFSSSKSQNSNNSSVELGNKSLPNFLGHEFPKFWMLSEFFFSFRFHQTTEVKINLWSKIFFFFQFSIFSLFLHFLHVFPFLGIFCFFSPKRLFLEPHIPSHTSIVIVLVRTAFKIPNHKKVFHQTVGH